MDRTLDDFAASVGAAGDVTVEGTASRGGGVVDVRSVAAPAGIARVDAAEMVVECGAGTPVTDVLGELAEVGQTVSVPPGGTIGGALAVGASDVTRLGHGPIRDVLLRTRYVSATGQVTTAGGPTVKNVSGFDLCRLLVGSHGTLGFFGDCILRTRPLPRHSAWFATSGEPARLLRDLHRPVSVLWDGATTWVRLDGDESDVDAAAGRCDLIAADGPPPSPGPHRWSMPPAGIDVLRDEPAGSFLAEVGVGVVHHSRPQERPDPLPEVRALHTRIKEGFDPAGRLNPGVDPLTARRRRM
ncbi:FAD-binding protein [Ilumatobacter sp.]|uniref:FAD-binding protein n=1 Tax=Ilumatobacter sp. TaxID=1967498 RepID=UPI003B51641D